MSMAGEPIDTINYSIQALLKGLKLDPYHLETSYMSIITFDSTARKLMPLTELYEIVLLPEIQVTNKGKADLLKALIYLDEIMNSEVVTTTELIRGDWKPLICVMTNGNLTFDLDKIIEIFKHPNFTNIITCLLGEKENSELFAQISNDIIKLPEGITDFLGKFKWVIFDPGGGRSDLDNLESSNGLPPPPPEVSIVI